jgi:magnesium chelatase subunit H
MLANINDEGRISIVARLNLFNLGKKDPWVESLYASGYKKVNLEEIATLFKYLEFCLEQVCADNELHSSKA